jgi:hypothetical protein
MWTALHGRHAHRPGSTQDSFSSYVEIFDSRGAAAVICAELGVRSSRRTMVWSSIAGRASPMTPGTIVKEADDPWSRRLLRRGVRTPPR